MSLEERLADHLRGLCYDYDLPADFAWKVAVVAARELEYELNFFKKWKNDPDMIEDRVRKLLGD